MRYCSYIMGSLKYCGSLRGGNMNKNLTIITGGGSGIGRSCAHLFAKKNHLVIVTGRNKEKLETTANAYPDFITPYPFDLNNTEDCKKFVTYLTDQFPSANISTLIHNAAIFVRKNFCETSDQEWIDMFQTNLFAPVRLTRLLLPLMVEGSNIINISSTLGLKPILDTSAYSASKAAMVNWTKQLALELAPKIRVNAVCPGMVETPIHDFFQWSEEEKQKMREELKGIQPLGRIGQPEDIAPSVYFLASTESAWTTGAILSVDGGINL